MGDYDRQLKALGADGTLWDEDIRDLSAGRRRVRALMLDGGWHTAAEIRLAAGGGHHEATEGLRRLRELRSWGFEIEKRRVPGTRFFEYRLLPPSKPLEIDIDPDDVTL